MSADDIVDAPVEDGITFKLLKTNHGLELARTHCRCDQISDLSQERFATTSGRTVVVVVEGALKTDHSVVGQLLLEEKIEVVSTEVLERGAGTGDGCTLEQLEAAIGPNTAAVAYLVGDKEDPSLVSYEDAV